MAVTHHGDPTGMAARRIRTPGGASGSPAAATSGASGVAMIVTA
jgi:hypothetical protein